MKITEIKPIFSRDFVTGYVAGHLSMLIAIVSAFWLMLMFGIITIHI